MTELQWTAGLGGRDVVRAEALYLGDVRLIVEYLASGQWRAKVARGDIEMLGEFSTVEEAQRRCLNEARFRINGAFHDLVQHEAFLKLRICTKDSA